jgi:hypothetical protein
MRRGAYSAVVGVFDCLRCKRANYVLLTGGFNRTCLRTREDVIGAVMCMTPLFGNNTKVGGHTNGPTSHEVAVAIEEGWFRKEYNRGSDPEIGLVFEQCVLHNDEVGCNWVSFVHLVLDDLQRSNIQVALVHTIREITMECRLSTFDTWVQRMTDVGLVKSTNHKKTN